MPLQYVDINNSQVTFVNQEKDPVKKTEMLESDMATMMFESMMDKMKVVTLEDTTAQLTF